MREIRNDIGVSKDNTAEMQRRLKADGVDTSGGMELVSDVNNEEPSSARPNSQSLGQQAGGGKNNSQMIAEMDVSTSMSTMAIGGSRLYIYIYICM